MSCFSALTCSTGWHVCGECGVVCSCGGGCRRVERGEGVGQCQRTVRTPGITKSHCRVNTFSSSKELISSLKSLKNGSEVGQHIVDIRGQGLMVAIEFASPLYASQDPVANPHAPKGIASRVAKRCMEKGVLILTTSVYEVIRFIPPLNISQEDLKKGCDVFAEAVREVVREG